jgi:hypothetical protein
MCDYCSTRTAWNQNRKFNSKLQKYKYPQNIIGGPTATQPTRERLSLLWRCTWPSLMTCENTGCFPRSLERQSYYSRPLQQEIYLQSSVSNVEAVQLVEGKKSHLTQYFENEYTNTPLQIVIISREHFYLKRKLTCRDAICVRFEVVWRKVNSLTQISFHISLST